MTESQSIPVDVSPDLYSKRRRRVARYAFLVLAVTFAIAVPYCRSLTYIYHAHEDHYQLWMSVLKPFDGSVYYVGSDGDYSYFRSGRIFYTRYKVRTSELRLSRTFAFGKEEPYVVTLDMVPEY